MKLRSILCILLCSLLAGCAQISNFSPWQAPSQQRKLDLARLPSAKHIALLLPLSGTLGESGQAVRDGFLAANHNGRQDVTVNTYDTNRQPVNTLYQQAVSNGADLVIGPLTKADVQQLVRKANISVPIIALNTVEGQQALPANFYSLDLSAQSEAQQAATKAYQDGYRSALVISPTGSWGEHVASAFLEQWLKQGGKVVDSLAYQSNQELAAQVKQLLQFRAVNDDNKSSIALLNSQRRQDADVILLNALPDAARQIRPLLKFYYAGNLPIYATAQVYSGVPMPLADRDLDGIKFPDMPWVINDTINESPAYLQIVSNIPNYNKRLNRLYALGLDAYLLSQQIGHIQQGVVGNAGNWSISDGQRIQRQLIWAQFQDGKPLLLNP